MFGFGSLGGGTLIGAIYAKVSADLSDFHRGMAMARAEMGRTADSMRASSSSIDRDSDRMGTAVRRGARDAERGLLDFDLAAKRVRTTFSGGPFGLVGMIGKAGEGMLRLGGFAQRGVSDLFNLARGGEQAGEGLGVLARVGGMLAPVMGVAVSGIGLLAAGLVVLPALAGAAVFALVALVDAAATLGAIVGGLVAPLTLVGGLLGLLAAGFVIAGKKALEGNGQFASFAQRVSSLGGMFSHLARNLGHDLLPLFNQLADAASQALSYFIRLSNMPLGEAMRSLATTGVKMLSQFVYGVADVLKRPFRLAVKLAFDSNGMAGAVTSWWTSLTRYLFGYTASHPVKLPTGRLLGFDHKNIDGALKPLVDWFNRQHFTKTGVRWGTEIANGILHGPAGKNIAAWAGTVGQHAGSEAGKAFKGVFMAELRALPMGLVRLFLRAILGINALVIRLGTFIVTTLGNAAGRAGSAVKDKLGQAWDWVLSKAKSIWSTIVGIVTAPLHVNIDWPSPPSWLGKIGGAASGAFDWVNPTATGGIVTGPQMRTVGEAGPEAIIPLAQLPGMLGRGGGGGAVHVHLHDCTFIGEIGDQVADQIARKVGPRIRRQS